MALLRLIHAADLPDPAAVLARLSGEAGRRRQGAASRQPRSAVRAGARCRRISGAWSSCSKSEGKHQLAVSSSTTRSGWSASRRRSWR